MPSSILGAEPFPTTTYSLDIPAGGGVLKAGHVPQPRRRHGRDSSHHVRRPGLRHGRDCGDLGVVYLTGRFLRDSGRGRELGSDHRRRIRGRT